MTGHRQPVYRCGMRLNPAAILLAVVIVGCGSSVPSAPPGTATPPAGTTPASAATAEPAATATLASGPSRESAAPTFDSPTPPPPTTDPFGGLQPTGPTEPAHVVRIVDGDTIHVLLNGRDHSLRYIGMDTPEDVKPGTPVMPMSLEAAAANTRLVAGRDVVLEKDVSETDRFGRLLRYVWLHDGDRWMMVDLELVLEGYAQVATYPPDVKYVDLFLAAERRARDQGLGLWGLSPSPSPRPH